MGWVTVIVSAVLAILKSIFGMDSPQKNTIERPDQEVKIDDGKTDKERLEDLGL